MAATITFSNDTARRGTSAWLRGRLFSIDPVEATFAVRDFSALQCNRQTHLERIGAAFLDGYHTALRLDAPEVLSERLDTVGPSLRGFAYEGAGMALSLLDRLWPGRTDRFARFLTGPAAPHVYMLHVGAGWAMARLPWGHRRHLRRLDPLLRWLAVDGYGFHEGYFRWSRYSGGGRPPRRLSSAERPVFHQGLGRSLWFVTGADPEAAAAAIRGFPQERQDDLWAGLGLACTYAGGAPAVELRRLRQGCGDAALHLGQGAAFAAKARLRAGNALPETDEACLALTGIGAERAAAIADAALADIRHPRDDPCAYAKWRAGIRQRLRKEGEPPSCEESGTAQGR